MSIDTYTHIYHIPLFYYVAHRDDITENFNFIKVDDVETAMSKQICGRVIYTGSVNEQILQRPGIMFLTRELLGKQKTQSA
jgi:hypothetical protein